jgi:hypothetical protein
MAQVLPLGDDDGAHDDVGLTLAGRLAALPQDWTVLRDRKLDGHVVDAVLVHPERGLALVSLAPVAPEVAAAKLRERLNDEHFEEFFPGALPIVVLGVDPTDIPEIEQRLGSAFRRAPKLAITDRDWADAVVALLLASNDLELTPAGKIAASPSEPLHALGPSDPESEGATALPSFSGSRSLASGTDHPSVPPLPPPAPRRGDWLVGVICTVVFAAELGVAIGVVKVGGLLPFSTPPGIETETASLRPPEAASNAGEPSSAPASEEPPVLLAQPLIASSPEPPTQVVPVTAGSTMSQYGEAFKVAKFRRHRVKASRAAPFVNGDKRHAGNGRDQYAIAAEIYQPGRRLAGW